VNRGYLPLIFALTGCIGVEEENMNDDLGGFITLPADAGAQKRWVVKDLEGGATIFLGAFYVPGTLAAPVAQLPVYRIDFQNSIGESISVLIDALPGARVHLPAYNFTITAVMLDAVGGRPCSFFWSLVEGVSGERSQASFTGGRQVVVAPAALTVVSDVAPMGKEVSIIFTPVGTANLVFFGDDAATIIGETPATSAQIPVPGHARWVAVRNTSAFPITVSARFQLSL
jgi:hypothetical protein